jgi:hypothetical protein
MGDAGPIRGFPGITVTTASVQTQAGSDFSIFVIIQNPFDVPITLGQIETHLPVELYDVNRAISQYAQLRASEKVAANKDSEFPKIERWLAYRRYFREQQTGVAIAVGTNFAPEQLVERARAPQLHLEGDAQVRGSIGGIHINFAEAPSSQEFRQVLGQLDEYDKGLVPITLQPGNSVVKQFRLRTKSWLFFTPLAYTFQIQVNYVMDNHDHSATVPYQLNIRSTLSSIIFGSIAGATLGALLKSLTEPSQPGITAIPIVRALAVAILASIAVVIAFSRKSSAQTLVSVEDFWGGAVIGFTVGYFGFDQFVDLFPKPS